MAKYCLFKDADGITISNGDLPCYLIENGKVYRCVYGDGTLNPKEIGVYKNDTVYFTKRNGKVANIFTSLGFKVN